ncbi:MAG: hypothetical protein S4CHLAM37_02440 [Chlamydiia bacterium]|nr:hypothetical protein [Chlamydiia bacterium]
MSSLQDLSFLRDFLMSIYLSDPSLSAPKPFSQQETHPPLLALAASLIDKPGLLTACEKSFIEKFCVATQVPAGALDPVSLAELASASDTHLKRGLARNCAKAHQVTKALYHEKLDLRLLCMQRPNLLIYSNDKFIFIRNTTPHVDNLSDVRLELLDCKKGTFIPLTDSNLMEMQGSTIAIADDETEPSFDGLIMRDDLILLFDKDECSQDHYPIFHERETVDPPREDKHCYHEKQKSGFCALHAGNAFVGKKVILPSEYSRFLEEVIHASTLGEGGGADEEASLALALKLGLRLDNGSDPSLIVKYLQKLADEHKIPNRFARGIEGRVHLIANGSLYLKPESEVAKPIPIEPEVFEDFDRAIIGKSFPAHVVALRKKASGTWVEVDSHQSFQKTVDPTEYLRELIASSEKVDGAKTSIYFYGSSKLLDL